MPVALALLLAVTCYACAAALAVAPLARPMGPPVDSVVTVLAVGVGAHVVAFALASFSAHELPVTGLGPALSFAGLALAAALLLAEVLARDVTLSLVAAPLAA